MKCFLYFCLVFLALTRFSAAIDFRYPSLKALTDSDAVYLVQATSIHDIGDFSSNRITFSVIEVLKGKPRSSLTLIPLFAGDFHKTADYILYYTNSSCKDTVGWNGVEDVCQWLQLGITRQGKEVIVEKIGPLSTLRDYLHRHS
jgi:hypothetical protein